MEKGTHSQAQGKGLLLSPDGGDEMGEVGCSACRPPTGAHFPWGESAHWGTECIAVSAALVPSFISLGIISQKELCMF